jgi:DNA polymerase-4
MTRSQLPLDKPRLCCLDLDTFFVSVERVLDPTLVGKPVVIGGQPGSRGVVTACSYEVRELGVRSGMSLTKAGELAPNAIYLSVRDRHYSDYARQVREIVERYSPVIQVASIDEMFFDLSGCEALYRRAWDRSDDAAIERTVRELTRDIDRELGLPASVGIATSRSLAKITSGLAKPRGVLLVPAGTERELLAPLPVRKLPGIGPVAEQKLHAVGIETLGQLAATPRPQLRQLFGAWADRVQLTAIGRGSADLSRDRPAFREHDPSGDIQSSISNERTFSHDIGDPRTIEAQLCHLADRVCWRARKRGVRARTVTLKLRFSNFETLTRARTLPATSSELDIYPVVRELFLAAWQDKGNKQRRRVRLLGVSLSKLGLFDEQMGLFENDERLHRSIDAIRLKYGFDSVRRAGGVRKKPGPG